ncbi:helix-turn-helix domain-containing protein [Solimonas soli]|uniref:helix-turn-helix domain-containing protein n=1 Tax=Solimonas soli TaxID=413479 RepID=UPI0005BCA0CC|nr:helix-turn-helix transcriptional regulator [Solimonas soli]
MAGKKPWDQRRVRLQRMLREARVAAGLLQSELADRIGADQSFVSRYERGERRLDLVELEAICRACGVTLSEFVAQFEAAPGTPRRK